MRTGPKVGRDVADGHARAGGHSAVEATPRGPARGMQPASAGTMDPADPGHPAACTRQRAGYGGTVLIAEELLLLLTDDHSGRLSVPAAEADLALAGANLVELALMGRVDISRDGDEGRRGRIVVRDQSPTGDDVLDSALEVVTAHRGRRPQAVIGPLSRHLRQVLYQRLAGSGVVRAEERRVLGLFPSRTWPAQDTGHEAQVRQVIVDVLAGRAAPDPRSAALVALAHALRCENRVVDAGACGLSRRQLRERAGEIARSDWASAAVRSAIDEMIAAVIAATTAASAASTAAG